jgi:CDP-paratose 2-epimerase
VVHCAAQPSHDLAAGRPLDDFDVNAVGTINILEAVRQSSPDAVFVHVSTNKVYGDDPNELLVVELPRRWDYAREEDREGVTEAMRIDQMLHSAFGASKVAADVMVQEYGRYLGLRTTCLRCGSVTGPNHSGVPLHGFLSCLVKAQLQGRTYSIHGYKGKQVRDNIHSLYVALAIEATYRRPRIGEVYNVGGGRANSCSILEAFDQVERLTGRAMEYNYRDGSNKCEYIIYIIEL